VTRVFRSLGSRSARQPYLPGTATNAPDAGSTVHNATAVDKRRTGSVGPSPKLGHELDQEAREPMQTGIGLQFEVVGRQVPFATDREDVVAHRVPIRPGS
jgi:hypothetical protein